MKFKRFMAISFACVLLSVSLFAIGASAFDLDELFTSDTSDSESEEFLTTISNLESYGYPYGYKYPNTDEVDEQGKFHKLLGTKTKTTNLTISGMENHIKNKYVYIQATNTNGVFVNKSDSGNSIFSFSVTISNPGTLVSRSHLTSVRDAYYINLEPSIVVEIPEP